MEKVTSIKFHCRISEETKTSKMKFKSVLIVLLVNLFVISTLIVEIEYQGRRGGGGGRGGRNHLIDKVCN